jgi:hypothetical protein
MISLFLLQMHMLKELILLKIKVNHFPQFYFFEELNQNLHKNSKLNSHFN